MGLRNSVALCLSILIFPLSIATIPARASDIDLSAYKGKVVYLDFWASWCTPCRVSFPWMNDIQETYERRGLIVIGVNVDHDRDLADEFLQSTPASFKIVYDPNGKIASEYNFKDMPTSVLIGRDGKIHSVHNGFYPNREGSYAADISALLDEKAQ